MIFMNSEINEIDLEALFFGISKMCFAKGNLPQRRTDFTETYL